VAENVETDEIFIPSMIVQPFTENAIWHGISNLDKKGMVFIRISKESEKSLKIVVEDNGIGMKKAATFPSGSGDRLRLSLELTRKRLKLLGQKFHVKTLLEFSEVYPGKENPGTRVEIVLPFMYTSDGI